MMKMVARSKAGTNGLALSAAALASAFAPSALAQVKQQEVILQPQPIILHQPAVIFRADGMPMMVDNNRFVQKDDPAAPARLQEMIAELGATDVQVREQASRNLENDTGISLAMIEQAVKSNGDKLSLEARTRLVAGGRDRFWRTPRGALGIQFWNSISTRVVVEQTFDKFDAATKIEDGDMIIEADGRVIEGPASQQRLQAVIVSHDPGETIKLVVRRGERKLNVDIILGRRDDLANASLTEAIVTRAWQHRASTMMGEDAQPPISTGLKASEWPVTPVSMSRATNSMRKSGMEVTGIGAVGGGMPRGADLTVEAISQRMVQGQLRNNRAAQQIVWQQNAWAGGFAGWDPNAEPTAPVLTRKQELDQLLAARASLVRDRDRLDRGNPAPPAVVINNRNMVTVSSPSKTLEIIEKQTLAIRAEMAEHGETYEETPPTAGAEAPDPKQP